MAEMVNNNNCKYAVVQFTSKEKGKKLNYIVVSSDWISTKNKQQSFYWPMKEWYVNKRAVRNCEEVDVSTWVVAPIKSLVKFTDNFHDAVLICVTLTSFNIDVSSTNTLKKVYDELEDLRNCPVCSQDLLATAESYSCSDDINEIITESSSDSFSRSTSFVMTNDENFVETQASPSLLRKRTSTNESVVHDESMKSKSPSLLESRVTNRSKKIGLSKKSKLQSYSFSRSTSLVIQNDQNFVETQTSPNLLRKRTSRNESVERDESMELKSPSLLESRVNHRGTIKRIRLSNKF